MSIIDSALSELDRNGSKSLADHLPPPAVVNDLLSYRALPTPPRRSRWTALALLLAGGAVTWGALEFLQRQSGDAEPPAVAETQAPVAVASMSPPPKPVTLAQAPAAPAPAATPAATPAPAAKEAKAEAPARQPVAPPAWVSRGWEAKQKGASKDAFAAWQAGVGELPATSRLLIGPGFREQQVATAFARRWLKQYPAFVLPVSGKASALFRLVAIPSADAAEAEEDRIRLARFFGWKSDSVTWIEAADLQRRITSADAVVVVVAAAKPSQEAPAASASAPAAAVPAAAPAAKARPVKGVAVAERPAAPPAAFPAEAKAARGAPPAEKPSAAVASLRESYATARRALAEQAYGEALRIAQTLVEKDGGHWEAHYLLGSSLLGAGRPQEAERALAIAGRLNPTSTDIAIRRAIAAQEKGDHAAAASFLRDIARTGNDSPELFINLAYSSEHIGDWSEAAAAWRRFMLLTEGKAQYEVQRQYARQRLEALGN